MIGHLSPLRNPNIGTVELFKVRVEVRVEVRVKVRIRAHAVIY